jgi:transposase
VDVIVARCAGLDVHKNTVMACVRAPGPDGGRISTVRRFGTFTDALRQLRAWLVAEGVTQVAMEATGVYWKPVWHVLEAVPEFELLLANAHAVKNMIEERSRETQRIQKLLEDAGIKLDSVVSDILGVSARQMLEALIAGVRDVEALAELAQTRMRPKIPQLRRALEGRFGAHHALMLQMHLDHVDQLSAAITRLDVEVDRVIRPFSAQLQRLITIPGVPGQPRVRWETPLRAGPQGQPGAARRALRSGVGRGPRQDRLPTRAVPTPDAHVRQEGPDPSGVRRRAQHPGHRLAPAGQ